MEKSLSVKVARPVAPIQPRENFDPAVAAAYNESGDDYIAYADGDPRQLFAFDGQYAYGDRRIWELLDAKLRALRTSGAQSVRILDLGCGPGTWLRRIVTRARTLGFTSIVATAPAASP
jgi:SAM-dependent methyltransferase